MRRHLYPIVLAVFSLVSAVYAEPKPLQGELLDTVCSEYPVEYAMLSGRGYLFIAYYDAERRLTVLSRKDGAGNWVRVQPEGFFVPDRNRMSNIAAWDSHNYLTMTLDKEGHLHLSGNMHADPLVYYRTKVPLDLTTLECIRSMTGEAEDRVTYPRFMRDGEGRLVYTYRSGGSGDGATFYNVYNSEAKTWSRLLDTPLTDGLGKCSAYGTGPRKGPDGCFHMLWMWRDTPNAGSNHTLTYARSRDLARWETRNGSPCPLPITPGQGDIIDPVPPFKGLINMCYSLAFDEDHSPVAAYHKYDADGQSQIYAARIGADGKWFIRQISDWDFRWEFAEVGSQDKLASAEFAGLNPDGSLNIRYRAKGKAGVWRINAKTLEKLDPLPSVTKTEHAPVKFVYPHIDFPGIRMNAESCARADGGRWILRWETLGRQPKRPSGKLSPPSELRLYALPKGN